MIFKKTITIIISLTFVILLNRYFTQTLDNYVEKINIQLTEMENSIKNDKPIDQKNIEKLENTWNEAKKKLALFVDHEELEKAEIEMLLIKINTERKDFDSAAEKIFNAKYMFTHMKEKNKVSIINIF